MKAQELQSQIALGEDSRRPFKVDVRNAESLAAEMAAFANSEGGQIFLGVADDGSTPGLAAASTNSSAMPPVNWCAVQPATTASDPASNAPSNNGRRSHLPTITTAAFFGSP